MKDAKISAASNPSGSTSRFPSSPVFGRVVLAVLALALVFAVLSRAGMTLEVARRFGGVVGGAAPRRILRVWDWWSPSVNEKFGAYFAEAEREFERLHPDVDLVYQYVPFGQYEQKMATALVGVSPPDVFQSSVSWAEGFYDRGMLLRLDPLMERERAKRQARLAGGEAIDPGEIVDREAFLAAAWRHNTKPDGTVFGIPQILDANCLMWNLDLLQQAAGTDAEIRSMFLRKPDGGPDWSRLQFDAVKDWDQFRRITHKLSRYDAHGQLALDSRGEPLQSGYSIHAHGGGSGPFMLWCAANGTDFENDRGTRALFADEAGREAMQYVLDLYWKDHVSPPFRRQLNDEEVFLQRKTGCVVAGTWAGKYVVRNSEGWLHFDETPFPPGPRGHGQTTLTWGNMLVISRRCRQTELAWEYVKFVTSLKGSLRLLRCIEQNSPRRDFYRSPEWQEMCRLYPYLWNVPAICASGRKLRHTQINAVEHASQPIFETLLLRYPEIAAGSGPYPSVESGLKEAADAVDRVYARYNEQAVEWRQESIRTALGSAIRANRPAAFRFTLPQCW